MRVALLVLVLVAASPCAMAQAGSAAEAQSQIDTIDAQIAPLRQRIAQWPGERQRRYREFDERWAATEKEIWAQIDAAKADKERVEQDLAHHRKDCNVMLKRRRGEKVSASEQQDHDDHVRDAEAERKRLINQIDELKSSIDRKFHEYLRAREKDWNTTFDLQQKDEAELARLEGRRGELRAAMLRLSAPKPTAPLPVPPPASGLTPFNSLGEVQKQATKKPEPTKPAAAAPAPTAQPTKPTKPTKPEAPKVPPPATTPATSNQPAASPPPATPEPVVRQRTLAEENRALFDWAYPVPATPPEPPSAMLEPFLPPKRPARPDPNAIDPEVLMDAADLTLRSQEIKESTGFRPSAAMATAGAEWLAGEAVDESMKAARDAHTQKRFGKSYEAASEQERADVALDEGFKQAGVAALFGRIKEWFQIFIGKPMADATKSEEDQQSGDKGDAKSEEKNGK
jgi:hypothetical protein